MKRSSKALLLGSAAGAGLAAWSLLRRRSWLDLQDKLVLITGGSRGLGLQLAREFGCHGAHVVICARDEAELERARQQLLHDRIHADSLVCDIGEQRQVEALVENVDRRWGPIDVLVNNAGNIQVGPLWQQRVGDFEQAMNTIFWGTLYPTLAVLPSMRERRQGRIVNITSIGGKVSIPHLLPYSCAKFAALALSEGLRTELAPAGIRVVTIVPGLMRTGSHLNAAFKGDHSREYTWFSVGAATPLFSISAERAARSIVKAAIRGDSERILSLPAVLLARVHGILPQLSTGILSLVNRFVLPDSPSTHTPTHSGAEAKQELNSRVLDLVNRSGERAAEQLNQLS